MRRSARTASAIILLIAGITAVAAQAGPSGTWTRQEVRIEGSWEIVERHGHLHVQLSDDFKTRNGPDLKIFLSRAELDALTGATATRDSVLVAPLQSSKGGQSYEIPAGIDLSEFRSIIIHCEKYSKLWGGSRL